jgi:hypothetical protein
MPQLRGNEPILGLNRIEEGCYNLINGVTLHLQKEKEDEIQEGHQKIVEEFELHLKDVHAKCDGIISKARIIKEKARKIEDSIVSENNIDEMHMHSEFCFVKSGTISTPSLPVMTQWGHIWG